MLTKRIDVYQLQNGVRIVFVLENDTQISMVLFHRMSFYGIISKLAETIVDITEEWSGK